MYTALQLQTLRPQAVKPEVLYTVLYWYEGLTNWPELDPNNPPRLPPGTILELAPGWLNQGDVARKGHIALVITRPDGTTLTPAATWNQDKVVNPHTGLWVSFEGITLNQAGAWKATIALSVEVATTVTVTLKARNAPANAAYWAALCPSYQSSDFIPIANPITWKDVPPETPQQWVIFGSYDAALNRLVTPNTFSGVGFSRPFENGKTYYWDFATGLLLDENLQWM